MRSRPVDLLTQAVTRDWIDQPAVARRAQLDPLHERQLFDPGDDDKYAKLERLVRRSIEDRARARQTERTTRRDLGLTIG